MIILCNELYRAVDRCSVHNHNAQCKHKSSCCFSRRTTVNIHVYSLRTTWHPLLRLIAESERVNAVRFSSTKWKNSKSIHLHQKLPSFLRQSSDHVLLPSLLSCGYFTGQWDTACIGGCTCEPTERFLSIVQNHQHRRRP